MSAATAEQLPGLVLLVCLCVAVMFAGAAIGLWASRRNREKKGHQP